MSESPGLLKKQSQNCSSHAVDLQPQSLRCAQEQLLSQDTHKVSRPSSRLGLYSCFGVSGSLPWQRGRWASVGVKPGRSRRVSGCV